MTEILLNWLNNDIVLSKPVSNISIDFHNGYLFAELLYKTKQIPKLSLFKNTDNLKDIIHNFSLLQKSFLDLGIILDEKCRNEIINSGPYTSKIYLFKIKQLLSKKNIDLEQLKLKESNTLQNLYNRMCFKNENEKYLYNLQIKLGNKERTLKKNNSAYLPILGRSVENILNNKYNINGSIYNEIKEKFAHLNFTDNDIKMIMEDMKENENKLLYLKDKVMTIENKRKIYFKEKNEEIKKKWQKSMVDMKNFKFKKLKESWEPAIRYKLACQNHFRKNAQIMAKKSDNFDNNLKFLVEDNVQNGKKGELSTEIIMLRMRQKLDDKLKNKRDKEKRERRRLKEEQEMNYRIFAQKSMMDMVNVMENNLKKNYLENNSPIKISEELIKTKDKEKNIEKEKVLNTKKEDGKLNENNKVENKSNTISGKSRKKNKSKNYSTEKTESKNVNDSIKKEDEKNNIIKEKEQNEKMGQTSTSSYSKLTSNDFGLGLINECFSIHNFNINVNDRIKLFKTLILPINKDELEQKYKDLPKIDLNSSNTNKSLIKNYSSSIIFNKKISLNNSSDIYNFDKNSYIEEIDKLNYEDFSKEFIKKKNKLEKKYNLLLPIFYKILEVTDYIENYQEKKQVNLIDNSKWDEIMIKFKNNDIIKDDEEKSIIKEEGDSAYLYDYGDKITIDDDKKIFDYINYIDIFNDLVIPNEQRGKKFLYPDLYQDFYVKQDNNGIDIKEYEPNEEENENLYLPKNSNNKNFKLSDIIENIIESKYKNIDSKNTKIGINNGSNIIGNIYEQKGKFYYLPIKMVLSGYPLSGKKTQGLLINTKYPGIKIYDPPKLLENKIKEYNEYKSLKEQTEKNLSAKGKNKNKNEEAKKELEEKIKEFEPILNIINPYIEYLDKINKKKEKENKENEKKEEKKEKKEGEKKKTKKKKKNVEEEKKSDITQDNKTQTQDNITQEDTSSISHNIKESYIEKEELLSDIYLKLIIYQLEKDFPDDKDKKNKYIEELKQKYNEYLKQKEKIEDINNKINEEELKEKEIKEHKTKNNKKNQKLTNLNKELDSTTKIYNSTKNSLYVGFIIINFPKNLKEAEKLENYFTGYISEFEKEPKEQEKKLYSYENMIDINVKQKTKKKGEISMLDLFIKLNINSDEVDRRYKGAKYDPSNGNIYHVDDNPPPKEDKKKESKLLPGIPNMTREEIYLEKLNYEKNIKNLERLYKAMDNGYDKVFKNIDQMDINYIHNLNDSLEKSISEIIFNNYYNNIEIIISTINNDNKTNVNGTIDNSVPNTNINSNNNTIEHKDKNNEDVNFATIQSQDKEINLNSNYNIIEGNNNIVNNVNNSNNNFSEELLSDLDNFNLYYKSILRNFIHFISRQKEHIINYLTSIQNIFVTFLNRKTEKTSIAEIYIEKYNSLLENHPEVKNIPRVYNELSEDIKDVTKSIWVNIQNKKNNDVKYLQEIKDSGIKDNEINQFWEYIVLVFESEVQKYLIICETIIKYYLSLTGLLNNIYGIFENNYKINKANNYLFKIDYKKFLFEDIDIPPNFFIKADKNEKVNNNINEKIELENQNEYNHIPIPEDENEGDNDKVDNNKLVINNSKENLNNNEDINSKKNKKEEKTFEEKIDILFMNSLKIIIRQDKILKKYMDKIKGSIQKNDKDYKSNAKYANSSSLSIDGNQKKFFNSSLSSRSSQKKKFNKKTRTNDSMIDNILYEEIMSQIIKEKRKFKYRLMFLKYYSIRYNNIINECYNETYNAMDDLIIMSVRSQNNTLNEFMNYLKKALNNFNPKISLDNFEFDTYDIYRRYKIDVDSIYETMKYNVIFNTDKIKARTGEQNKDEKKENNENNKVYINEEEMSYIQLFIYNLNDLMYIYNYIKTYGAETCNFLVKYDIVKEILIHQYFTKKNERIYEYNKNDNENNILKNKDNKENSLNFLTYNPVSNYNLLNSNDVLNQMLNEENNGICKKILFCSNINYTNFLNKFSLYNNNYININELFTSLLILGSNIITSDKFMELIKEYIPENKKDSKSILLTKEEFMKIPMWFEKDDYLNILNDSKEEEYYLDITKYYYSEENIENNNDNNNDNNNNGNNNEDMNKPIKINAIKEAIFEINSEDNILDLNKIIMLLNKINGFSDIKSNVSENKKAKESLGTEEKLTSENINIITNSNNINIIENEIEKNKIETINNKEELNGNSSLNEEINKLDINTSKRNDSDYKVDLTIQSDPESKKIVKHNDNKSKINNIFNVLFIS